MIPLNTEQHLGRKAYFLMVSKKTTAAFVFLLITVVVLVAKSMLLQGTATAMKAAGTTSNAAAVSSYFDTAIIILLLIAVILFFVGILISRLQYRSQSFTLEEFDLKMKSGIFSQKEISIPYRQIQDVEIERGLYYQFLGLSKVIMKTAGQNNSGENEDNEIVLDPIDKDNAEQIRVMLQRQIGVQVVEGEKEADKEVVQNKL